MNNIDKLINIIPLKPMCIEVNEHNSELKSLINLKDFVSINFFGDVDIGYHAKLLLDNQQKQILIKFSKDKSIALKEYNEIYDKIKNLLSDEGNVI